MTGAGGGRAQSYSPNEHSSAARPDVVVCIGDVHGQLAALKRMWASLEAELGSAFHSAHIIFLGDIPDRGVHVKQVFEFMLELPARYPLQHHVCLMGNHDMGMATFLGLLEEPADGVFERTWRDNTTARPGEQANWWSAAMQRERHGAGRGEADAERAGVCEEQMHMQGRRWGGFPSVYSSENTFRSYGVQPSDRAGLLAAVPESHKRLLRAMPWVHEVKMANGERVVAVHAGLTSSEPVDEQLRMLRARDLSIERVEQLSGRDRVCELPPAYEDQPVVVVSGHHGYVSASQRRIIVDSGMRDLSAVVLPHRIRVGENGRLPLDP